MNASEYVNGPQHGKSLIYRSNGQLWGEQEFNNGNQWNIIGTYGQNNQKLDHGTFINSSGLLNIYDKNDLLNYSCEYKNGLRDGEFINYNQKGQFDYKRYYKTGNFDFKADIKAFAELYVKNLTSGSIDPLKAYFFDDEVYYYKFEMAETEEFTAEQKWLITRNIKE